MQTKSASENTELVPLPQTRIARRSADLVKRGLDELTSKKYRIVRFPSDRSMGTFFVHTDGPWREKDTPPDARGILVVPAEKRLNLKIDEEAAIGLSPMESLRADDLQRLSFLNNSSLRDTHLAHIRHLTALEGLYLQNTQVGDDALAYVGNLIGLNELTLSGTRITDRGISDLSGLKSLRKLALNNTQVSDIGLITLGSALTNLEVLRLNRTEITDLGLEYVAELACLWTLTLADTQVTDAGIEKLCRLQNGGPKCHLTVVILDHTRVTDACFSFFLLHPVEVLSLSGCPVGNANLICVADLKHLQLLDLSHTLVTNGTVAFRKNLPNLQVLSLNSTAITDSCLPHLFKLTALKVLDLSFTNVTENGIDSLREALPGCRIVVDNKTSLGDLLRQLKII